MSYEKVSDLSTDTVYKLGGVNAKTGKPNPTTMEGYYLGFRTVQTINGDAKIHTFETPRGNEGIWGSKDVNDKLGQVKPGTMTLVEFTGKKRLPGGKTLNTFSVSQDKSNITSVAAATQDVAPDEDFGTVSDDSDADVEAELESARVIAAAAQKAKVQEILNRGKGKKA